VIRPWFLALATTLVLVSGCGGSKDPTPPSGPPAPPGGGINGRERIGWDQSADNTAQLDGFQYAIYVDGARNVMAAVSCSAGSSATVFACSGKGPDLSVGQHTIELAAFTSDGEGPRSAPLVVTVSALTTGTAQAPVEWPSEHTEKTSDGVLLRTEKVIDGLEDPVDALFAPDGRLFIAERRGRVRIAQDGQLQVPDALTTVLEDDGPAESLLSIAIAPDFERTHFVFAVHASRTGSGDVFRLVRYRELRGTLAERAVLIEGAGPPIADAAAVLRVASDGKFYVAVGAPGFPGTLMRINADGTRPQDQAGTAPAVAQGLQSPRGLAADPRSGIVWIADEQDGDAHLSGVAFAGRPIRAVVRARHPLPDGSGSLAFYAGKVLPGFENTLLLASATGRHIERIRLGGDRLDSIAASETLLQDAVGPIQVVIVGPDGAIYFCTSQALGKLTAQ
jgi:glucose/arabinose dehydrogenase